VPIYLENSGNVSYNWALCLEMLIIPIKIFIISMAVSVNEKLPILVHVCLEILDEPI
jgi:hypothetical protein